jgi:hypothetical protein
MDSVVIIPQGFKNLKMKFKLSPQKKKKKKKKKKKIFWE